ncbi:MAG: hypothetical protein AAB074_20570 [Planctomycetota bacterium]
MRGARLGWSLLAAAFAGCDKPPAAPAPVSMSSTEPLPDASPRDAWEARRRAWLAGDAKAVWESLCAASREEKLRTQERAMDEMRRLEDDSLARALNPYGLEASKFRRMTAEEFCLYMIGGASQVAAPVQARMKAQVFVSADIQGRTAICTIASTDGSSDILVLVAERGSWKVDDAATARMRGGAPRK